MLFSKGAEESVLDGFRLISDPPSPLKNLTLFAVSEYAMAKPLCCTSSSLYFFKLIIIQCEKDTFPSHIIEAMPILYQNN